MVPADGPGPRVRIGGREFVSFASNDYLGLAGDPRLADAMAEGARSDGAGAGAARLVTGGRPSHDLLEREAAALKGAGGALLAGCGYALNVSLVPALAGEGDLVVSDRLNHASLVDGCRLSRAEVVVAEHGSAIAVTRALGRGGFRRRVVLTEGLFSMDGDEAPLAGLAEAAARYEALLVVDDAHGTGVLGPRGAGLAAEAGLRPGPGLLEVATLGKAFGAYGAFAAWTGEGVEYLRHAVRGFVFSTALPPGVAAAAVAGMRIAAAEPWRRERALLLARRLREGLRAAGVTVPAGRGPAVPVPVGGAREATALSARLEARGWWVPPLRPPTVPPGTSRLRLTVSAAHRDEDVDGLVAAVAEELHRVARG